MFFFRSIALLVLISPPHQVRTAAHTASEYDSYLHRRCWTAAASKGLFCLVCIVLVLVAVRFGSWTMMAELCFSVDDFMLDFFSNTAADTASEYDSCGHRRCCTAAASCPCYSCRRHAKPVGLVLPRVCCFRIRAKAASI